MRQKNHQLKKSEPCAYTLHLGMATPIHSIIQTCRGEMTFRLFLYKDTLVERVVLQLLPSPHFFVNSLRCYW